MPNFVQYNPWMDAANYGRAMGQSLGAILFQVPEMRRRAYEADRDYELRKQHLDQEASLLGPRAAYYQAQAAAIPERMDALNEANSIRRLAAEATRDYNTSKHNLAVQEAESKKALRDAQAGEILQRTSLFPEMHQAKLGLLGAQQDYTNTKNEYLPQMTTANASKVLADPLTPEPVKRLLQEKMGLPPETNAPPSLLPPRQPQQGGGLLDWLKGFLPSGGGAPKPTNAVPDANGLVPPLIGPAEKPLSLNTRRPPNATHTTLVRNRISGKLGWADQEELNDPDSEWSPVVA